MHSINRMVLGAIAIIALLVLGSAGASVWSNGRQADARANIMRGTSLLRNHMTADMMHDAIRGDVLSALRATSTGDLDRAANRQALADDATALRKAVAADAAYANSPAIAAQARRIQPLVDAYVTTAERIADAAAENPAPAIALLPGFLEAFEKLEGGMSTLSDAIETHMADISAEANAIAQFANILLVITTSATLAVIIAIGFATRRFVVAPLLALVDTLKRMTSGDMAVAIPAGGRRDELGQLAGATQELRDQLVAAERAKEEQTTLIVDSFGTALDTAGRRRSRLVRRRRPDRPVRADQGGLQRRRHRAPVDAHHRDGGGQQHQQRRGRHPPGVRRPVAAHRAAGREP